MREIKFKALIKPANKFAFNGKGLALAQIRRLGKSYFREDVLWLEYTGLKDNTKWEQLTKKEQIEWLKKYTKEEWNGKEIYEGDIYETQYNDIYNFAYYKIVYDEEKAAFYCECIALHHKDKGFKDISQGGYCNFYLSSREGKIISNIYENPELLNNKI